MSLINVRFQTQSHTKGLEHLECGNYVFVGGLLATR